MHIDKEFQSLIPPLTAEEYSGLEESILSEGCRDALVMWGDTLIDGHNRYEICTKHNIPFKTVTKDFASREDVKLWMIGNQLARRNINNYARTTLECLSDEIQANRKKNQGMRTDLFVKSQKSQVEHETVNTAKEVARRANVGEQTASRVMTINKSIDAAIANNGTVAGQNPEELKRQLMNGDITVNKAYNAIKLDEKKESILQAQRDITKQADGTGKTLLYVGDGIGRKLKNKCDLLLTDPPYSTDVDNVEEFANSWLYNALENVKDTGFGYVFIGAYPDELKAYLNARIPEHMSLVQVLVWTYKNTLGQNPKDRYKLNWQACLFYRGVNAPALDCPLTNEQWAVQEINAPDGRQGDRYHAWQKPLEIGERFVRHTTKPGDTVFDPFACTGTFLIAASKLGRKGIGFEIDPDNAQIAEQRGVRLCRIE
jgi:DNA modification methylase